MKTLGLWKEQEKQSPSIWQKGVFQSIAAWPLRYLGIMNILTFSVEKENGDIFCLPAFIFAFKAGHTIFHSSLPIWKKKGSKINQWMRNGCNNGESPGESLQLRPHGSGHAGKKWRMVSIFHRNIFF